MASKPQAERPFRYYFPKTEAGETLRRDLAKSMTHHGITFRESEEVMSGASDGGWLCVLLILEITGKRPGEGRIAADMKARK